MRGLGRRGGGGARKGRQEGGRKRERERKKATKRQDDEVPICIRFHHKSYIISIFGALCRFNHILIGKLAFLSAG